MESPNKRKNGREVPVEAADLSSTVALPLWYDSIQKRMRLMYNPWASRKHAYTIHAHNHTIWAEHIHINFLSNALRYPAKFRWHGKIVYIVGRGASLEQTKHILEKPRKNPAIFLNHSFVDVQTQPNDFVLMCDSAVTRINSWQNKIDGLSLLTFPGMSPYVLQLSWRNIYGFVFWPKAPMNDWMRRLYPYFPQLDDSQMISVPALHLAALNGARAAVLIGQDYTVDDGDLTYIDLHGREVKTIQAYAIGAMAVSKMAQLCRHHTNMRIINTSNGLAGVNLFPQSETEKPDLFDWFEFKCLKDVYKEFEDAT